VKCEFDLLFKPTGALTAAAIEKRENKKGLELQKRQLAKDLKNVGTRTVFTDVIHMRGCRS